MSEEQRTEQALKAYAAVRNRAAGDGSMLMPGPMRERLRAEIARVYADDEAGLVPRRSWLGWALKLFVPVTAVGAVMLVSYQGWKGSLTPEKLNMAVGHASPGAMEATPPAAAPVTESTSLPSGERERQNAFAVTKMDQAVQALESEQSDLTLAMDDRARQAVLPMEEPAAFSATDMTPMASGNVLVVQAPVQQPRDLFEKLTPVVEELRQLEHDATFSLSSGDVLQNMSRVMPAPTVTASPMTGVVVPTPPALVVTTGAYSDADAYNRSESAGFVAGGETIVWYSRVKGSHDQSSMLQKFELRRSGQKVLITDADGSRYEGTLIGALPAEMKSKDRALGETRKSSVDKENMRMAVVDSQSIEEKRVEYRFIARGISRSLNREVQISGSVLTAPSAAPAAGGEKLAEIADQQVRGTIEISGESAPVLLEAVPAR